MQSLDTRPLSKDAEQRLAPLVSSGAYIAKKNESGLSSTFSQDSISSSAMPKIITANEINELSATLTVNQNTETAAEPTTSHENNFDPIHPTPLLETPEASDAPFIPLPTSAPSKTRDREKINLREIEEIVSMMSEKTLVDVMAAIMTATMEIEKENVLTADTTNEKYQVFRKIKMESMMKIKDAILSDEKLAAKLKTPAQIAAAASLICGLAAASISFGVATPIGLAIGGTLGAIFSASITALSTAAPFVAAACAGMKSFEAYCKWNLDQEKGDLTLISHQDKYYDRQTDVASARIQSYADADATARKYYGKFLKNQNQLVRIILSKA